MTEEFDRIPATIKYKIPFLLLGVATGMLVVWVALQWVPGAFVAAMASVGIAL